MSRVIFHVKVTEAGTELSVSKGNKEEDVVFKGTLIPGQEFKVSARHFIDGHIFSSTVFDNTPSLAVKPIVMTVDPE